MMQDTKISNHSCNRMHVIPLSAANTNGRCWYVLGAVHVTVQSWTSAFQGLAVAVVTLVTW